MALRNLQMRSQGCIFSNLLKIIEVRLSFLLKSQKACR